MLPGQDFQKKLLFKSVRYVSNQFGNLSQQKHFEICFKSSLDVKNSKPFSESCVKLFAKICKIFVAQLPPRQHLGRQVCQGFINSCARAAQHLMKFIKCSLNMLR